MIYPLHAERLSEDEGADYAKAVVGFGSLDVCKCVSYCKMIKKLCACAGDLRLCIRQKGIKSAVGH